MVVWVQEEDENVTLIHQVRDEFYQVELNQVDTVIPQVIFLVIKRYPGLDQTPNNSNAYTHKEKSICFLFSEH